MLERRFEFQQRIGLTKLRVNPPEHTRMRAMARATFAPARVEAMRAAVTELVDGCLDRMAEKVDCDVMTDLGLPLSVGVIGNLVGIPPEEHERFRRPFVPGGEFVYGLHPSDDDLDRAERALEELEGVLRDLIAERRVRPRRDVISDLLAVRSEDGKPLAESDVLTMAFVLFLAGFVTATHLIGNGLLALFRHPEQMARLWADGSLVPSAIEEMLRWESPFQWVTRNALEPAKMEDLILEKGDTVIVLLGSANRDGDRFPEPDRFDVARPDNKPLAFGWGIHHCLGAALARLEGEVAFHRLRERFELELLDEDPPLAPSLMSGSLRGYRCLPVRVSPLRMRAPVSDSSVGLKTS
ncbi:MAG: cytochrome P450 [Actinomycetota bacterium]|nr:cytochrome P450 [Actinomycetota bacterium]